MLIKPMRAVSATDEQIEKLLKKFGRMYAMPKLDGIRCLVQNGIAYSKSLMPIPSKFVQSKIGHKSLNGFDGELMVGNPVAEDVYRQTCSGVMAHNKEPNFKLFVFDYCNSQDVYAERYELLQNDHDYIYKVPYTIVITLDDVQKYEETMLANGFEGIILRDPEATYKQGKSTALEGGSIKIKRFHDAEARIIGMEELMHNNNEAVKNELGRTQRSSCQENKTGANTLGKLVCLDLESGKEFKIGVFKGLTAAEKQEIWFNQENYINQLCKYKSFKIGVKDKPRHSTFLGWRHPNDI